MEPEVIIMDEATSALDVSVQKTIIELITKLQREKNITIGFICHDIALIEQCAHQIAVMYLGNVVEVLPGGQLSKDAVHPYTRALMGSVFDINSSPYSGTADQKAQGSHIFNNIRLYAGITAVTAARPFNTGKHAVLRHSAGSRFCKSLFFVSKVKN